MAKTTPLDEQVTSLVDLVARMPKENATPKVLDELLEYVDGIPSRMFPSTFAADVAAKFGVSVAEIERHVMPQARANGRPKAPDFDSLVPDSGWLHDYIKYTRGTEPPTIFHLFCGMSAIGAALGRNVRVPLGSGAIYPNLCIVLVAPPGATRKTIATKRVMKLARKAGINVLEDQLTPPALIEGFRDSVNAVGFLYAPELSVMLGRQAYMDGMIPLLTAWFDCPDQWAGSTIARGKVHLRNLAISHLGATTAEWMKKSVSRDAVAGGFMSRILFISQERTDRRISWPPPLDATLERKLISRLARMRSLHGDFTPTPETLAWHDPWYKQHVDSSATESYLAGYHSRKNDRLLQVAMILSVSKDHSSLTLELDTMKHALRILEGMEYYLPNVFADLAANVFGEDQTALLRQIRDRGGSIKRSAWIKMNTSRMNRDTFRRAVETLVDARLVVEENGVFHLLPAGWSG